MSKVPLVWMTWAKYLDDMLTMGVVVMCARVELG